MYLAVDPRPSTCAFDRSVGGEEALREEVVNDAMIEFEDGKKMG